MAPNLTNGHKVWTSSRLKRTSWPKLCYSSWALRCNDPLAAFPWNQTDDRWSRPQSCPQDLKKLFITITSPPTSQLLTQSPTPNPQCLMILPYVIFNLHTTEESGLSEHKFACTLDWPNPIIINYFLSPLQIPARPFLSASTHRRTDHILGFDNTYTLHSAFHMYITIV